MISIFDLYKIGIGPSSSHTVGPMKAANLFLHKLLEQQQLAQVTRVKCELFGSLGATGKGHGSDIAVMLGLMGETPEATDTELVETRIAAIRDSKSLHFKVESESIKNVKNKKNRLFLAKNAGSAVRTEQSVTVRDSKRTCKS